MQFKGVKLKVPQSTLNTLKLCFPLKILDTTNLHFLFMRVGFCLYKKIPIILQVHVYIIYA